MELFGRRFGSACTGLNAKCPLRELDKTGKNEKKKKAKIKIHLGKRQLMHVGINYSLCSSIHTIKLKAFFGTIITSFWEVLFSFATQKQKFAVEKLRGHAREEEDVRAPRRGNRSAGASFQL